MNRARDRVQTDGPKIATSACNLGLRVLLRAGVIGFFLVSILLTGCNRDDLTFETSTPQEPVPSGYVRTEVKLSVDENREVTTRATDAEEKAYDKSKVYLLVFDNDSVDPTLMQRPVKATISNNRLFALLRATGDARNLYIVTGLSNAMNTALEAITDTDADAGRVKFSDVNALLKTTNITASGIPIGGTPPAYTPMCTERIDRTSGTTLGTATLTEIAQPLKRIVARIDVECVTGMPELPMPTDAFELEGVTLINGAQWSYVLPQAAIPVNGTQRYDELTGVVANAVKSQLYLYEDDATNANPTMVIVRGIYKGGESGFYRLDILNTTGVKPYNALTIDRNTRYTIKITDVKTSGYRTLEEAMQNSAANNIEYNVNVDDGTSHDVVSNGEYYIGSSASEYVFYGDGEQTVTVATISHNAPATLEPGTVAITALASTGGSISNVSNPFAGVYDSTKKNVDLTMTLPVGFISCTATLHLGTLTKTILISRKEMIDLAFISEYLGDKFTFAEREGASNWITLSGEELWNSRGTFTKGPVTSEGGKLYLHLEENLTPYPRRGAIYGHKGTGVTEQDRYRIKIDFFQRGTEGLIAGDFGGSWSEGTGYTGGLLLSSKSVPLAYKTSNTANDPSIVSNIFYGRPMNVAAAALADPSEYPSFNYCARLNRDLDGSGKIEENEMKWYMPATMQLLAGKSYRPLSALSTHSSASEESAEWKMTVYPEGTAIITFLATWAGGEKTNTVFATRCVRDIPKVGYPRYETGGIISHEAAPTSAITSVSKRILETPFNDQYRNGATWPLSNAYWSENNTIFKRFEVSGIEGRGDWATAYAACIAKGEGWRLPTNRESISIILTPGFDDEVYWSGTERMDVSIPTHGIRFLKNGQNLLVPSFKTEVYNYRCIREIGAGTGTATLKFSANGGGGSVADMNVFGGSTVTMPLAPVSMHKNMDGYNGLFAGWNTEADGSGRLYLAGSSYVVGAPGSTTTFHAHYLAFAPGNVVRNAADQTKLTFGESSMEGLRFQAGSLVALNSVSNFSAATSVSFRPAEYIAAINAYTDIPHFTGSGVDDDLARDAFITTYPYVGYDASTGVGDICRYMSDKGMVPDGTYWRLPTAQEGQGLLNTTLVQAHHYGDWMQDITSNSNGTNKPVAGRFLGLGAPSSPSFSQVNNPPVNSIYLPATNWISADGSIRLISSNGAHLATSSIDAAGQQNGILLYKQNGFIGGDPLALAFSVRCVKDIKHLGYTLSFDANGGSGAPASISGRVGNIVLPNTVPVYNGHTFVEWNTQADGNGISYGTGANFMLTANTTLYAKWVAGYMVRYHGNGADGGVVPPNSTPVAAGVQVTVVNPGLTLTKSGCHFIGWSKNPVGDATQFYSSAGGYPSHPKVIMVSGGVDLYAQWITPDQVAPRVTVATDGTLVLTQLLSTSSNDSPLLFKFGSVIGLRTRGHATSYVRTDVAFDPRVNGDISNWSAIAYASGATFPSQTLASVRAGVGDPCKLVGKTMAQIAAGDVDNFTWRLPSQADNELFSFIFSYGGIPVPASGGGFVHGGLAYPQGSFTTADVIFLPDGYYANSRGYFQSTSAELWSSTIISSYNASLFVLLPGEVRPSASRDRQAGYHIRCIRQ